MRVGRVSGGLRAQQQSIIGDKVVEIACTLVERAMSSDLPKNLQPEALHEHYKRLLPGIVDALVHVNRRDVLYNQVRVNMPL